MKKPNEHDENGIHGYCIAYLDGHCMLRIGPKKCYNKIGNYNDCPIRNGEKGEEG